MNNYPTTSKIPETTQEKRDVWLKYLKPNDEVYVVSVFKYGQRVTRKSKIIGIDIEDGKRPYRVESRRLDSTYLTFDVNGFILPPPVIESDVYIESSECFDIPKESL